MEEVQPARCSFMIGTEVIILTPNIKKPIEAACHERFLSFASAGSHLNSADSAWLTEILFTRRRHLSEPVFTAGAQRRYSAIKRRLLRRSLPTINEQEAPLYDDDDDEGCCDNLSFSTSSNSEPTTPNSLSAASSPSGSDDDEFAQKWNKISSSCNKHSSTTSTLPTSCQNNNDRSSRRSSTLSPRGEEAYYELFGDEVDADENVNIATNNNSDSFFIGNDDLLLSRQLEIEAAVKRKDGTQHFYQSHHHNYNHQQMGVIGQLAARFV